MLEAVLITLLASAGNNIGKALQKQVKLYSNASSPEVTFFFISFFFLSDCSLIAPLLLLLLRRHLRESPTLANLMAADPLHDIPPIFFPGPFRYAGDNRAPSLRAQCQSCRPVSAQSHLSLWDGYRRRRGPLDDRGVRKGSRA